jgi:hypothetical protein
MAGTSLSLGVGVHSAISERSSLTRSLSVFPHLLNGFFPLLSPPLPSSLLSSPLPSPPLPSSLLSFPLSSPLLFSLLLLPSLVFLLSPSLPFLSFLLSFSFGQSLPMQPRLASNL